MHIFKNKEIVFLILVFLAFGSIYSCISLVNHYYFRTYALDLGMFNNAIYDFAHFRVNSCKVLLQEDSVNFLGCHFSLLPIIFSPFYWIFGSYTLLIIQIAAILFGGLGIYKTCKLHIESHWIALIILVQFFSIWGIYSALSFDYHDNVIAAMLVPWLFYFFQLEKVKEFGFVFFLILISKENMAMWLVFIIIGLAITHKKIHFGKLKYGLILFLFSAIFYFIIVSKLLMPHFNPNGLEQLSRYSHLGNSLSEILTTIITRPQLIFTLLFENITSDPFFNNIKSELHFMVLVSGGFVLIFKPQFLIFLLPIYAQKLFSNDMVFWGINAHYSIEFVPVLSLVLIYWLKDLSSRKNIYLAGVILLLTICSSISALDHRESKWYNQTNSRFYQKSHYIQNFDVTKAHEKLEEISPEIKISAMSPIIPHLAFREAIYHFPFGIEKADKLVLFKHAENYYPLSEAEFQNKIKELITSGKWVLTYDENNLMVLDRN